MRKLVIVLNVLDKMFNAAKVSKQLKLNISNLLNI